MDAPFVASMEFAALLTRLHAETVSQHRDCWCAHTQPPPRRPACAGLGYAYIISQLCSPLAIPRRRVACEDCNRWRELSAQQMAAVEEGTERWTCLAAYAQARPPQPQHRPSAHLKSNSATDSAHMLCVPCPVRDQAGSVSLMLAQLAAPAT